MQEGIQKKPAVYPGQQRCPGPIENSHRQTSGSKVARKTGDAGNASLLQN
jgi:hypothetical protein